MRKMETLSSPRLEPEYRPDQRLDKIPAAEIVCDLLSNRQKEQFLDKVEELLDKAKAAETLDEVESLPVYTEIKRILNDINRQSQRLGLDCERGEPQRRRNKNYDWGGQGWNYGLENLDSEDEEGSSESVDAPDEQGCRDKLENLASEDEEDASEEKKLLIRLAKKFTSDDDLMRLYESDRAREAFVALPKCRKPPLRKKLMAALPDNQIRSPSGNYVGTREMAYIATRLLKGDSSRRSLPAAGGRPPVRDEPEVIISKVSKGQFKIKIDAEKQAAKIAPQFREYRQRRREKNSGNGGEEEIGGDEEIARYIKGIVKRHEKLAAIAEALIQFQPDLLECEGREQAFLRLKPMAQEELAYIIDRHPSQISRLCSRVFSLPCGHFALGDLMSSRIEVDAPRCRKLWNEDRDAYWTIERNVIQYRGGFWAATKALEYAMKLLIIGDYEVRVGEALPDEAIAALLRQERSYRTAKKERAIEDADYAVKLLQKHGIPPVRFASKDGRGGRETIGHWRKELNIADSRIRNVILRGKSNAEKEEC